MMKATSAPPCLGPSPWQAVSLTATTHPVLIVTFPTWMHPSTLSLLLRSSIVRRPQVCRSLANKGLRETMTYMQVPRVL